MHYPLRYAGCDTTARLPCSRLEMHGQGVAEVSAAHGLDDRTLSLRVVPLGDVLVPTRLTEVIFADTMVAHIEHLHATCWTEEISGMRVVLETAAVLTRAEPCTTFQAESVVRCGHVAGGHARPA